MLRGNQLYNAMVEADPNLVNQVKPKRKKKHKNRSFTCHKCGNPMIQPEETNLMYCPSCEDSFFIFDKK